MTAAARLVGGFEWMHDVGFGELGGPQAVCSRCSWAYFAADWPGGPGPIVALLEHDRKAHGRVGGQE